MVFVILIAILLVIIGTVHSLRKQKNETTASGNELIDRSIDKNDISVTDAINIPRYNGSGKFIIDDKKKFVHYFVYTKGKTELYHKQFSYKDVLRCEIVKDGRTAYVHDVFSFIGRANKKEYIKKFGIRIIFNDLDFPYLDIYFVNSSVGVTLTGLGAKVNLTNEWLTRMNIIAERGKEMARES